MSLTEMKESFKNKKASIPRLQISQELKILIEYNCSSLAGMLIETYTSLKEQNNHSNIFDWKTELG
jgi:hypothetical protein